MRQADLVAGARRVYDLHRKSEARRRRSRDAGPIPAWDDLSPEARRRLVEYHRALRLAYDRDRPQPREVKIS